MTKPRPKPYHPAALCGEEYKHFVAVPLSGDETGQHASMVADVLAEPSRGAA